MHFYMNVLLSRLIQKVSHITLNHFVFCLLIICRYLRLITLEAAVSESNISGSLQRHRSQIDVDQDAYNSLRCSFISPLRVMSKNKTTNTKAPKNQLRQILADIAKYDEQLGANEFYLKIVSPLAEDIGEQLGIKQTINCIDCKYSNIITESRVNSFALTIPNDEGDVSITSLFRSYFEHEVREKCQQCSGRLYLQHNVTKLPSTHHR